jgi:FKBP-type peptidyl-prolyl cis-trans isomerase FklB
VIFFFIIVVILRKKQMGIADKLFNQKNEKAAANLKAGEDFLAANKQKPGIVALPSGLQYEVISTGGGIKPLASNDVTCHYHGTLIDGTVFDSSVKRGQPATFPLNGVIKGWTEGLQLMPSGSKWRFFIPPHLGYGDRQVSAQIGPNSTLVFEVELLDVK